MKKFVSLALSLCMVLSLGAVAFADSQVGGTAQVDVQVQEADAVIVSITMPSLVTLSFQKGGEEAEFQGTISGPSNFSIRNASTGGDSDAACAISYQLNMYSNNKVGVPASAITMTADHGTIAKNASTNISFGGTFANTALADAAGTISGAYTLECVIDKAA